MADLGVATHIKEVPRTVERTVPATEHMPRPESPAAEQISYTPERVSAAELAATLARPTMATAAPQQPILYQQVETILEEGLGEAFSRMNTVEQFTFKTKGEEITRKIAALLAKPKIHLQRIISLVRQWLLLLPGVNRFFVEQTAKIKADKIIALRQQGR